MRRKNKIKKDKTGKVETNIRELRRQGKSPQEAIRIAIQRRPKKEDKSN